MMLAKCANHACLTRFRYLENGTLFRLESDPQKSSDHKFPEYFWLCRGCSPSLTLRLNGAGRIRVAKSSDLQQPGDDGIDFVLLDRQNGTLLSRITLFQHRGRRQQKTEGGQAWL